MNCSRCGAAEAVLKRDAAFYCGKCALARDWEEVIALVQEERVAVGGATIDFGDAPAPAAAPAPRPAATPPTPVDPAPAAAAPAPAPAAPAPAAPAPAPAAAAPAPAAAAPTASPNGSSGALPADPFA